ncbi:MAG TPA: AAA family ATPase, partial [Actinomycetota bacterium]|nr:AAA family ATPase [Actinomycetota bacterium]
MPICPNCGEENPERAKFCWNCGTPLQRVAGPSEERKVVTVLFCDLVGFTTASDQADPEDVKARLRPFHARIKREIEGHGGTLDKFIGDAALGVFGSPTVHEDDPERAVRTALAIVGGIDELNAADPSLHLAVRVGVNTGEAVVAYGAGPQIGEAVTGDVVNTASRLQGVAPVGGIVVGEPTFRATREVFVYEPLPAVTVKGKAEPLAIWRAVESRGRIGQDLTRAHTTPFVGRTRERAALAEAFERSVDKRSAELVLVLGEPGVGKTRLVADLGDRLDHTTDLVTWRRGRCLPYGEGITFWALGEIVKAHAGVLDSDEPEEAAAKLDAVIPQDEPDRQWLKQRLAPLVGVDTSSADREESFTAWRRFLESIARTNPAVFVFDDVQWADDALLSFLEHLAGTSRGAPMLILCTARPELDDRRAGWPAVPNATTVALGPLSSEETASLVSEMLQHAVLPPDLQSAVLGRAGGNPLYAEEFVRMLQERGLLVSIGGTVALTEGADLPAPESIQALIAARLDGVGPSRKALLQDAAVVGQVFWAGAVAEIGGRDGPGVQVALQELAGRELVHRVTPSSLLGQDEFAFSHALVRDVAYAQIPRASRAERHRAAGSWIERAVPDRLEDHAEVLAYHYVEALELSRAAGSTVAQEEVRDAALRFLILAGERALGLDVRRAQAQFDKALELSPPDHPVRPRILTGWADSARQSGRFTEAAAVLEESIAAHQSR